MLAAMIKLLLKLRIITFGSQACMFDSSIGQLTL